MSPSEEFLAHRRHRERAAIVAEVMSRRDVPVRHRKRRTTFVRYKDSEWVLWAVAVLMVLISVGLGFVAYAVLTKGAI